MTDSLRPGDLAGLAEPSLAAAREFTALAALARSSQNPDAAVTALAEAAVDEVAFAWLWALVRESEQRWRRAVLPERVAVPKELQQQVTEFVLRAPDGHPQRPSTFAEDAAARLLRALGQTPLGVSVARAALSDPEAPSRRVRAVAIELLGASTDPEGRTLVLARLVQAPEHKRAVDFARLHPPYTEAELAAITAALEHVTNRPLDDADFQTAATVAVRLPDESLAKFLTPAWPRQENKQKIVQAGLVQHLGAARLRTLLAHPTGDDTTQLLLAHAPSLPAADLPELGSYTFATFPPEWSQPIWNTVAQTIQIAREHPRLERREPALAALWQLTLASSDERTARSLADLLDSGDLLAAAHQRAGNPHAATRMGAVAAALLQRKSSETWAKEVAQAATELGDDYHVGLSAALPPKTPLPEVLRSGIMESAATQAQFARSGFGAQLVTWAEIPSTAETLLKAAHADLSDSHVLDLLSRADWVALAEEPYIDLCGRLGGRLPVLSHELRRAVESLAGPEASAAPPSVLTALLTLALSAGLRHDLGDEAITTAAITRLLDHPATSVVDAACICVRALDLDPTSSECDHHRVRAVTQADDQRGGMLPALSALRADLAARLSELAQDADLATPRRVEHLMLAAEVRALTARSAALVLGTAVSTEIRGAAAAVLAATPGGQDDLDRIASLLELETRQDIRRDLETAKHRIRSGTIGEAMVALADLLGIPKDSAQIDPQILVPDSAHHERFVHWVDKARARADNQNDPGSFIEAGINVADLMVDIVLIAATEAGINTGLRPEQVQALRDNGRTRPDIGDLLVRQHLQPLFRWFPLCAALRRKRTAHPSPLGSTQPHDLGPDDLITAKTLLRDITQGWIDDMHRHC